MGVFSTLQINPHLFCPYCGQPIESTQTYSVGYCESYRIGDKVKGRLESATNKKYLIQKDELICNGKDHDKRRSEVLNLGLSGSERGNPYNTFPMFSFSCFKDKVYKGTVLSLDDALLLLDFPEDEELEVLQVY